MEAFEAMLVVIIEFITQIFRLPLLNWGPTQNTASHT